MLAQPDLTVGEPGANLVVLGDNLAALRALSGPFQLVYGDPPYNTGEDRRHFRDRVAPDAWRDAMRERVRAIAPLLAPDGALVLHIGKDEAATLKLLCDEVLGRDAYVTTIAVRMSATSGFKIEHTDRTIVKNTEYLLVYARRLRLCGRVHERAAWDDHYALLLSEDHTTVGPFGVRAAAARYRDDPTFRAWVAAHADRIVRTHTAPAPARAERAAGALVLPPGRVVARTYGRDRYLLRATRTGVDQLIPIARKLAPVDVPGGPDEVVLTNIAGDWWDGFHPDMGNVQAEGGVHFVHGKKPERLLRRVIALFTRPGERVLDPWAGSGTTAAVAHKMGRSWVTVESGPQAETHVLPRLRRVVAGQDPTGVTAATGWAGGGGFAVARVAGP